MVYYNPHTRANLPENMLLDPCEILPDDVFYHILVQRAYKSRQIAEKNCDFAGACYYLQDGKLMRANSIRKWSFVPVEDGDGTHDGGINWGTQYFNTEEDAKRFNARLGKEYQICYDEFGDVYSVHYHY